MRFDDDSFDLAVASLALCHLADPTTAVVELGRVLRPGGTLVIADAHPTGGVLGGQAWYGLRRPGERVDLAIERASNRAAWCN